MTDNRNGPTSIDRALEMLSAAATDIDAARALLVKRPTRKAKHQAFRLLSGVESAMATLKIAIDPW